MNLDSYIRSQEGTATLSCPVVSRIASAAECSAGTLYMIAKGHKVVGPKLAGRIEIATGGVVTRQDLRPDLFGPAPEAKAA